MEKGERVNFMKKLAKAVLSALLISSMIPYVSASDGSTARSISRSNYSAEIIDCSAIGAPDVISDEAPTETWVFGKEETYRFMGASDGGNEYYSSCRFAGAMSGIYRIHLENRQTRRKLKVQACRASDGKVLATFTVKAGETGDFVLNTSHVWYLKISGEVYGYVDR